MSGRVAIGLDDSAFRGRLRQPASLKLRAPAPRRRQENLPENHIENIGEVLTATTLDSNPPLATEQAEPTPAALQQESLPAPVSPPAIPPWPYSQSHAVYEWRHTVQTIGDRVLASLRYGAQSVQSWRRFSKRQLSLFGIVALVLIIGSVVGLRTLNTNHLSTSQAAAIVGSSGNQSAALASQQQVQPSIVPPSAVAIANYSVAQTMPRYLNIPELAVHARIQSLGLLGSGALPSPDNIFDAGWDNDSSLPGEPGALLVIGHVSSQTSRGIFYNIQGLVPGDQLQIVRGDGIIFTYEVVKSQLYPDGNVNMQTALTPIDTNTQALNLITSPGEGIPGTSSPNARIVVYTKQL